MWEMIGCSGVLELSYDDVTRNCCRMLTNNEVIPHYSPLVPDAGHICSGV